LESGVPGYHCALGDASAGALAVQWCNDNLPRKVNLRLPEIKLWLDGAPGKKGKKNKTNSKVVFDRKKTPPTTCVSYREVDGVMIREVVEITNSVSRKIPSDDSESNTNGSEDDMTPKNQRVNKKPRK